MLEGIGWTLFTLSAALGAAVLFRQLRTAPEDRNTSGDVVFFILTTVATVAFATSVLLVSLADLRHTSP